jgi:flagellar motor protein MotB
LKLLIDLPPSEKARIKIVGIAGHTDRVPVRHKPRRVTRRPFSTLKELSDLRANAVKKELKGFASLPEANELMAAEEATAARAASHEERAKDRKVVVRWEYAEQAP